MSDGQLLRNGNAAAYMSANRTPRSRPPLGVADLIRAPADRTRLVGIPLPNEAPGHRQELCRRPTATRRGSGHQYRCGQPGSTQQPAAL